MRLWRVMEGQLVATLRRVEAGRPAEVVFRRLGVAEATFYRWNKVCEVIFIALSGPANSLVSYALSALGVTRTNSLNRPATSRAASRSHRPVA